MIVLGRIGCSYWGPNLLGNFILQAVEILETAAVSLKSGGGRVEI